MKILACDPGSSSYKAALYELYGQSPLTPQSPLWSGEVSWDKLPGTARVRGRWSARPLEDFASNVTSSAAAVRAFFAHFFGVGTGSRHSLHAVEVAAHRVVHGGSLSSNVTLLTHDVKAEIHAAIPLAPDHNPTTLAGITAVEHHFGAIEQFAIFDSAFHATLPPAAYTYATPLRWREVWGMRRLGFHGISHHYCAQRCAQLMEADLAGLKIVSCHLGNGSSLAAIQGAHSIDTTMGWTPLEGLVMGDRSGSVDPGMLLYLIESGRMDASALRRVLHEESGLLGISGVSRDMRDIVDAVAAGNPRAQLAFDVYIHRLRSAIGAMIASLGGLDALVFTGGVGENVAHVRHAACEGLEVFGLHIDEDANRVSPPDANVAKSGQLPIYLIHTEERWAMARECHRMLSETLKV